MNGEVERERGGNLTISLRQGPELVRADGHPIPPLLKAISQLMPLDAYVPKPGEYITYVHHMHPHICTYVSYTPSYQEYSCSSVCIIYHTPACECLIYLIHTSI